MSKIEFSVSELIATIKKSAVLNIIIEGRDDVIAYRNLEELADEQLGKFASVISAGGRDKVLQIHDELINDPSYAKCIFVCDQDFWIFNGVPAQYQVAKILCTDGYSIESDLFRDYNLYNLLAPSERARLDAEMDYFKKWFSYRVAEKRTNAAVSITTHVNEVIDSSLDMAALQTAFDTPGEAADIYQAVCADPVKLLRGKSYLALYVRQLSATERRVKHSALSLFEHAVAAHGHFLCTLERRVLDALRDC